MKKLEKVFKILIKTKDEKKSGSRYSIADENWWEKSMFLELQNLLKYFYII